MRKLRGALPLLLLASLAWAAPPAGVSLVVRCNEGLAENVRLAAEAYMLQHPEAHVVVLLAPPLRACKAVMEGTADLALSTKVEADQLQEAFGSTPSHLEFQPVARGPLVFFVNEANPVTNLSVAQLRQIYSGQVSNWKRVGGPDRPIHLISEDGTSGIYDSLRREILLPDEPVSPHVEWVAWSQVAPHLSHDPAALGYSGSNLEPAHSHRLKLGGISPTPATLEDGSYPAQRDICLVSLSNARGPTRQFCDYLLSDAGFEVWKRDMVRLK